MRFDLNSADSSSLSDSCPHQPNRWVSTDEFENPTSAPLIAPVDTITPVPLLYHVHTFYMVRYNSPTTQPSQPTDTTNELQQRKRTRNKRRINKTKQNQKKKKTKNEQTQLSTQTKYNVFTCNVLTQYRLSKVGTFNQDHSFAVRILRGRLSKKGSKQ